MLNVTVMNLLTAMWLQLCQTKNAKLGAQRAPAPSPSAKGPSENCISLSFCFLN